MRKYFLIIFFLMGLLSSVAQVRFNGYYEPFIELKYNVTERYSHKFSIEERMLFFESKTFKSELKQFDIAHFSTFKLDAKNAVALGLQYRFKDNQISHKSNELRVTEQYSFVYQPNAFEFEHRLRAEQRITSVLTSHRFRYKFGVTRGLKGPEIETGDAFVFGEAETLLTVGRKILPKYEQRIGTGIGWLFTEVVSFELVVEYRFSDFTQKLGHEPFVITGVKFQL